MRLKRLTLHGFKSFADKTEFVFDEGLTGIIGPNGCGKSNVVDATKWVLGDQRPTSLRGKEMLDVIFNGAEGRSPMGCSEVLLHLERVQGDGPEEMTVGRRLFRSGESEYLLNNQVVRLKDVKEALMDTGLGVGAYSVMEQGKIDAVLSANPEERRSIFDEAAGISRYKVRRKEALRKLDRTEQNLARVADLRAEKQSRVRSLKIQATKARNWRETAERLRALRTAVAVLDSSAHEERLEGLEARLLEAESIAREAEQARDEAREAFLAGEGRSRELGRELAELQETLSKERGREGRFRHEIESGERRLEELGELGSRSREGLERLAEQERETREGLAALEERLEAARTEKQELDAELPQLGEEARESRRAHREAAAERERLSVVLLEVLQERTMARNRVRDEALEIQGLRAREERLARMGRELGDKFAHSRRQGLVDKRLLWDLEQRRERVTLRLAREVEAGEALGAERKQRLDELHGLEKEGSSLRSRLSLLEELEASQTGLGEAAKELLQEGRGVLGRLVDYVDCPLELGVALEAALGERVQTLVLEDGERAREAFEVLAGRKGGGELVLVEAGADEGEPEAPEHTSLATLDEEGLPLLSFLKIRGSVRRALSDLLSGVLVVPDLEAARRLRSEGEALVCVTLRGEVVDGSWLRGGRAEAAAGLVQRRAALEQLHQELEQLELRLQEGRQGQERLESEIERKLGQRRRLEILGEALVRKHQLVLHSLETRELQEADLRQQIEASELEASEIEAEALGCKVRMMRPMMDQMLLERREARLESRQSELNGQVGELDVQAQRSQERLALLQRKEAGVAAELRGLEEKRDLQAHKLEDLEHRREELVQQRGRAGEEERELEEGQQARRKELEEAGEAVRGYGERVAEAKAAYDRFHDEAEARREAAERLEAALEEARDRRGKLVLEEREARFKLDKLEQELRESYGFELARLRGRVAGYGIWRLEEIQGPRPTADLDVPRLQGPPAPPELYQAERELPRLWEDEEFSPREAGQEASVLASRLQRMGTVNLEAEEELAKAESDCTQLEQDCQDLEVARKELLDTIRKINVDSRKRFQETFDEARTHFQEIFRMLFQGGKADMELIESEDPLEAGIEIYAKPPGKELRSIRLLSGGERSLTALAILFAVFKVKPSPFCILDEVDAALDEANVERFLRVLAQFVGRTQFLVVTHHKRTMADCQVLYGITMQRKGISSRMAVSLQEVQSGDVDRMLDHEARPDVAARRRVAGEEAIGFGEG